MTIEDTIGKKGISEREFGQMIQELSQIHTTLAHLVILIEGSEVQPGLKMDVVKMKNDMDGMREELRERKETDGQLANRLTERETANGKLSERMNGLDARVNALDKFRGDVIRVVVYVGGPLLLCFLVAALWWAWGALIHQPGTPFPMVPTPTP